MSTLQIVTKTKVDAESRIIAVALIGNFPVVMHHHIDTGYFILNYRDLAQADIQAFADLVFPITRCQHEYDCCGHTYLQSNTVQWTTEDDDYFGYWKITSNYIQNI